MNRFFLLTATAVAATGLAAAPAIAGLAGNASFSHNIPVRVPSDARSVDRVNDQLTVRDRSSTSSTPTALPSKTPAATRTSEPGDDRGGASREPEPGEDRGGVTNGATEPGDDRGGVTNGATEPGDDHGGHDGSGHH